MILAILTVSPPEVVKLSESAEVVTPPRPGLEFFIYREEIADF